MKKSIFILLAALTLPAVAVFSAEWRDMLRAQIELQKTRPDLSENFPGISPDMARLGEAFAKTCYPENVALGRRNFLTMTKNLGMENPTPGDLRQFLNPNKKPWDGYAGATNGNFHMLCNSGTLSLDTSDGCSQDHPAFAARRKFGVAASRVKPAMQAIMHFVRAENFCTGMTEEEEKSKDGATLRQRRLAAFREAWKKHAAAAGLNAKEIDFAFALLPVTA